jgi:hypothetical protein
LSKKNANFFAEFFGENIFLNHNIGPRQGFVHLAFVKRRKWQQERFHEEKAVKGI